MGRKKKSALKKRDARGYQQHQSSSCAKATTSVSTKKHEELRTLLGTLGDSSKVASLTAGAFAAPPSDRFASRLAILVDRLEELGFKDAQIEQVVKALAFDITLDKALDWLCLNLNTLELPALFTDGRLRDSLSEITTSESLTVLKVLKVKQKQALDSQPEENHLLIAQDSDQSAKNDAEVIAAEKARLAKEEMAKKEELERKNWLLQQYQYEDEADGNEADEDPTPEIKETEPDESVAELTPEELYLQEEEGKLKEMDIDLKNDANNYMRSKQEIKQLQIQLKKQRQHVTGLRRKVERQKAKREQEEKQKQQDESDQAVSEVDEEQEGYGGGLFGIFGQENDEDAADGATSEETPSSPPKVVTQLDYVIPKGWTGTTPQRKLEEVCKKQKLVRPKYTKLPRNEGFRLSVHMKKKGPTQEWQASTSDFKKGSSLRDYLATQALYGIDPAVPLYQVFPTPFRNLWLSWLKEAQDEENQAQQQQNSAKQDRIDHLMSLLSDLRIQGQGNEVATTAATETAEANTDNILDDWEDGDTNDDTDQAPLLTNMSRSVQGKKMQAEFVKRQKSPAYLKMKESRDALPMRSFREQVLDIVQNNPVTILCAETGAGKTTQCPQFIMEQALLDGWGDQCQILCTQPRRVAATSVSERVAEEMCDPLGKMVGYQIRMESKRSAQTKLLFCTTGVVLRRLQDDSNLKGITHVIVDEVHERQQQTDLLLIILRQMLATTRPDLKVVLMSATMDTKLFCSFFQGAPMISIPGRAFPVSSYYLEDLMDATDHVIEEGSRYAIRRNRYEEKTSLWVTTRGGEKRKEVVDLVSQVDLGEVTMYPGYKMPTRRSMERVNEEVINYDLVEDILSLLLVDQERNATLVAPDGADMSTGSVLVFLPGLGEIKSMTERLEGNRHLRNKQRFEIIPMHSTLSSRDQRKAFVTAKKGCRKIILSTNIAETSVTIPDVVCVIDTGRVREVRRNKRTSTSVLATDWCSKASAKQRAGRAGRVQPGLCLKMYSSVTAEKVMKASSEPELRRVPLEEVCLSILASGFAKSCIDFLNQAPQPPSTESVEAAIAVLSDVGAIAIKVDENSLKHSECLTPLGRHLAKLPVDVRLGKMLIFGALFQCIDTALTIAAALSSQSPFSTFVMDAAVAKAKQKVFSDPDSDFMTYCNVWDEFSKAAAVSSSAGRKFCHSNYLNYTALREIGDARRQFLDLLCGIGFLDRAEVTGKDLKKCSFNKHSNKLELVHAVICAGLYPHVARLEQPTANGYNMLHKQERLYFHGVSVNAAKKRFLASEKWVVFHEKFGTPSRTSVSTTCFVHPFALLLFGGSVTVKYTERLVIVDEWVEIGMAAQIGVILRELRKKVDSLLQKMIEQADSKNVNTLDSSMIEGIISILVS